MPDPRDPLDDLFAPLRRPVDPSPTTLDQVRRSAIERTRRRRLTAAGSVATALVVSALALVAIDRGQPGTFVGEAGAREVLRAAADATRGDELATGWRWSRTTSVQRMVLEGRRCRGCPTERATIESRGAQDVWTAPDGETYWTGSGQGPVAVENEPLLRAAGLGDQVDRSPSGRGPTGMHVPAAVDGDDAEGAAGLGMPGWISRPTTVPTEQRALVRWVRGRIAAQDRAWRKQAREPGRGTMGSTITGGERVAAVLVDLATSPQLSGRQQAAAFEALATLADVRVSPVPAPFSASRHVAVRIAGGSADRTTPFARPDRVVLFDRENFRVVAEQTDDRGRDPGATFVFGGRKGAERLKRVSGGTDDVRYVPPVPVAAPGLDDDGRVLLDVDDVQELGRDGQPVRSARPDTP